MMAEGAIVRIKLANFITYDAVEFHPGPNLNVIIGPNGTGKSTIVCAICLGLAGKTSLLGRAQQSSEFIKHGCDRALIEIELFNVDGDNWVIKREILRNNTSQWTVNGRSATQRAVEETVGRLNIQIGNLCQFLPQDKVADFAKMSQQELLENTEKAVGPPGMFENHCRLKTARDTARDLDIQYRRTKEQLERDQALNSRLEQDVRNFEEREKHLKRIKVLRMKRPWVEYDEVRSEYVQQKEQLQKMTESVRKLRAENAPMREKLEAVQGRAKEFDAQSKRKTELIKDHAKKALANSKEFEEQTDKIGEIQEELVLKKREESQRCQRLADLTEQLRLLQSDLSNLEEQDDMQPAIEHVVRSIMKTTHEMASVHRRGDDLRMEVDGLKREINNVQNQLQQVHDISNRRLEQLRKRDRDTHTAVLWLRANRHLFRATIHEPMMLIINVREARYAKFVESAISYNDMRAFVCENGADMELFLRTMSDEQGLRVNAVKMPTQPLESFVVHKPIEQFRQYGFFSYLRDLFDCPDAVMCYLCLMYRAHLIPVGTRETKNQVERIIRENPTFYNFYTEHHQYNIKRSRYGNKAMSSRCTELKSPQLLTVTLDVARKDELEHQLTEKQNSRTEKEQEYRGQQQSLTELEQKLHRLRSEKKTLMEKKDMRRILTQKVTMKQGSIQTLDSMAVDVATEEKRTLDKVSRIVLKKCTLVAHFRDEIQHCWKLGMEKVRISLRYTAAQHSTLAAEAELRESSVALQALERDYETAKESVKQTKEQARQLLLVAQKAANIKQKEDLPPDLQGAFATCPATLAQIDDAIHQVQARADCTSHSDESVVAEYRNRKMQIESLENDLETKKSVLQKHTEDIEAIRNNWLPPLRELVAKINTNFSHFFKVMGNAGEVDLKVPEIEDDYEKYGVCIKVKYRDSEQLQELTPHQQSGGERSVATVLYMMALQELTRCPFRCVDEINQGMDPRNERKIFELVSKTACSGNSSQYFMLTPKLLPDLDYSEDLTMLCVFNGPQMISHTDWKFKKFLHRRARLC